MRAREHSAPSTFPLRRNADGTTPGMVQEPDRGVGTEDRGPRGELIYNPAYGAKCPPRLPYRVYWLWRDVAKHWTPGVWDGSAWQHVYGLSIGGDAVRFWYGPLVEPPVPGSEV